ncbi:putative ras-related protein rab-18 [Gloeopeniophorella convolvens]|nr:putative ras-related protein rab-18 [Gloeopeniophorella convolvens]
MASETPLKVEVVLVGGASVGKSALITRLCDRQWRPEHLTPTIGSDYRTHTRHVDGVMVKLKIWDTTGMERFRAITPSFYRRAQGIIIVFDISRRNTFDELPNHLREIEKYAAPEAIKIIVGNKLDMKASREVPKVEAAIFADVNDCLYAEASAKTPEGVTTMFDIVTRCIIGTPRLWSEKFTGKTEVKLETPPSDKKGCMC